uniref:Excision repair cross-complementation group 6-like 2 n=1 Tax=Mastacembelus armatus TaxID=205130 RepID=A0A7N9ATX9_9TELE
YWVNAPAFPSDLCLAPATRDGTLREATIQRLSSNLLNNETKAWVIFSDHNKDAEEEEEDVEGEAVPLSKLIRPPLNHCNQEKPVFPSSITAPKLHSPLELSDVDGDRVPYTINRYLRDYQREGIKFIYNNYICSRGCILGDDMGLGKTVQVIGFLAAVLHKAGTWEDIKNNRPEFLQSQVSSKQSKPNKVFLIVAPLSVLYNWKDELDTWGHFQCVVVHGLKKEEELARIRKGRTEVALTTYETLRLCLDQFNNIDWSAVIVDEAHKIKNPNSQITQAMKDLRCKVRKIGLTGTILQNNLEELWCVMDWAVPGCLGSLGYFKNKFSDPIEQGQRHSATKRALATGRKTVRALVRRISHWFLRRTKALIKEQLPKKDDRMVYCSLTDFQQTVYQAVLDTEDVTLLLRSSEKCDCQSGRIRRSCCYKMNSEGVQIKDLYFSYLTILRKVANHVALLQSTTGTSKKQEKYVSAICQNVFQNFPDFVRRCKYEAFEALSDPVYSGKMKVLQKLLKYYLQKRDKVLLFSLSTKLLDVLENYCMAEGLDYSRLDGNTKSKDRIQIVKEFNSSTHINLCLVSTMAGGLGLNFVGANVVVLFDPTWNPASDLQAIDRAYRIGQSRDVTVLRLISLGTVEEVIYLRQVYKQQLQCSVVGKESARRYFEAVQGHGRHGIHKGELFGIKNLFRLQTQGTCLTRQILEREGQVEAGVMTTRTHAGKEEEERKRISVSNSAILRDPEHRALIFPILHSMSFPSLLQHGFSRLLERVKGTPDLRDGDSSPDVEENPSDTDDEVAICIPTFGTKSWDISCGSEGEDGGNRGWHRQDKVSRLKKSNDAIIKRQDLNRWTNKKITDDQESDEHSSPDKKPDKLKTMVPTADCFEGCSEESEDFDLDATTWSKQGAGCNKRKRGVPGVAHTHSNQRVVGGSKAEELISRAAVRDVYERKMNSQLPANHLLGTQEVHTSPFQPCPAVVRLNMPTVVYPVTFTSRSVHHTRHTTFIVGETPQAIRRQQLEEMAEKFKFLSVSQFAAEVLRRNSSQRLAFLREYYTSLNHPDLTNTVTNNFPQPDSVQTSSSSTVAPSTSTETAAAKSHVDSRTLQKDVPKATKKTKYSQKKQKQNTKQNSVSVKQKKSKMPQNDFPECQTKVRNTEDDKSTPKTPSLSSSVMVNTSLTTASPPKITCHTETGSPWLFDSLSSPSSQPQTTLQSSTPLQPSKTNRKDFWDILNEGNDESINRLTDPAEVQRVCFNSNFLARSRSEEKQSKSLWKANEKFLWKK